MEPPLNLTAVITQMVGSTDTACPCCNHSQQHDHGNSNSNSNEYVAVAREPGEPPIYIRTSEFDISVKEIVILCLLLLLVIYSISMFINNWSRNYRDITQPAYIVTSEETEEEDPEAAHLTAILPWDHDEDLSLAESRMSKLSQVVQAKSVLEKSRKDGSIICSLASDCQFAPTPTKSFSASNLFHKTRAPNLILLRQAPVNSNSKIKHFYSFEDEFQNFNQTPRISIDDTGSNSSLPLPHNRPYLKYHRRSHNRVSSMDSDPSRPASQPDVSRSNLQICTSREDGGSFSFSDLDPVQEATEGQEEPEDKK